MGESEFPSQEIVFTELSPSPKSSPLQEAANCWIVGVSPTEHGTCSLLLACSFSRTLLPFSSPASLSEPSAFFLDAGTHPIQHSPSFFWTRGRIQSSILPVYFGRETHPIQHPPHQHFLSFYWTRDASNPASASPAFSHFFLDARRIQSSIRISSILPLQNNSLHHTPNHPKNSKKTPKSDKGLDTVCLLFFLSIYHQ